MSEIVRRFNVSNTHNLYRVVAEISPASGTIRITAKSGQVMKMVMRKNFAEFLGVPVQESNETVVTIQRSPMTPYYFAKQPQFQRYLPSSLWIYCNVIRPSILSGDYLQVIRIVNAKTVEFSLSGQNISPVVNHSFDTLQWHELATDTISNITFDIRDQTGQPIKFDSYENMPTVFTLMFRRKK